MSDLLETVTTTHSNESECRKLYDGPGVVYERTVPQAAIDRPPILDQCVKERFKLSPQWELVRWTRLGRHPHDIGLEIEGGVYPHKKTRGKYKGRTDYHKPEPGTELTVSLTYEQIHAWERSWEMDTGLCCKCHGSGLRWHGWTSGIGTKFRPCEDCKSTGLIGARER